MFQKILVALDDSPIGDHIFEEALSLAKTMNAALLLLHVLTPMEEGYPLPAIFPRTDSLYLGNEEAVMLFAQQWKDLEKSGLKLLQQLSDRALAAGVTAEFSQNTGDPGRVICKVATTWEADLIVVGRRGHSGLSELFLGSASNYVLHHAPCSVLALQGKLFESES
ncbi:universal stress protein [Kovacikia minuta CCNUW1]|uniref:universal stress protein n=1 Tax=Kovacikia minuta TaxID=2931930 RepID=UPI001CCDCB64|nr:universal stress protein [Kovacikia minuta]UBF24050.1 universal stress protein [Kovacikia minuta CCNUW1]